MKYVRMKQFIIHGDYDESKLLNDIALLSTMRKIPLNVVKRVILMKSPPRVKYAYVSGWGNDEFDQLQLTLKHTNALMQTENVCKTMGWLPPGVFCAGPVTGIGAAEVGDSGGALIINGIIQIGLVSYKMDSKSLVGYTNVSYFLDWIRRNSKRLYCEYGHLKTALKHTSAKLQNLAVCKSMGWLPVGTFCAGPVTGLGAANE
ncbi:mast cell protease 1A-like [Amyelois transitella]|uniref:mast cell protease 1A-like n=1 Tax=Amyelois transitella TaxID=680683 RepID=UPI0029902871|nr:mast cell protease 1A-like [Amyelois transitella]